MTLGYFARCAGRRRRLERAWGPLGKFNRLKNRPDTEQAAENARLWMQLLARYRQPSTLRGLVEIALTLGPLVALWVLTWFALDLGYWLALPLAAVAAGFLVRLFMIQHDCSHGSFFRQRLANDWLGRVDRRPDPDALRLLAPDPRHASRHLRNLDRRGIGDIDTLTVEEYRACSRWKRLRYRLYRHPAGDVRPRPGLPVLPAAPLADRADARGWRPWVSTMATNLAIGLALAAVIWLIGIKAFLLVHLPIMLLAASAGVWLFYVQHQFEDTTGRAPATGTCMTRRCTAARTTICRASCAGSPPISASITSITSAAAFPTIGCRACCAITPSCARSAG